MVEINPSSAMWAEAIINMFARETGRDHDRINVLCLKPKNFPYVASLLIALLVFKIEHYSEMKIVFWVEICVEVYINGRKFRVSQACV